jgi:hypothetical protein
MSAEELNPRTSEDYSLFQGRTWLSRKIVVLIGDVTPKCIEMTRLISMQMDQPLPIATRLKMRLHYLSCCYCKSYFDNLRYTRKLLRLFPEKLDEISPMSLSLETKDRIKRALGNQPSS